MYAVIRAGGKQYRVAPGDVIRVETLAGGTDGKINFGDVLAISTSGAYGFAQASTYNARRSSTRVALIAVSS